MLQLQISGRIRNRAANQKLRIRHQSGIGGGGVLVSESALKVSESSDSAVLVANSVILVIDFSGDQQLVRTPFAPFGQ